MKPYNTLQFARSYEFAGAIVSLPRSGLKVIQRRIRGQYYDLLGVYPFVHEVDVALLELDLQELSSDVVSLVMVADPFCSPQMLENTTHWEVSRPFKRQSMLNLQTDDAPPWSKNLRRDIRIGTASNDLSWAKPGADSARTFWNLYQRIVEKHQVDGIARLSEKSIEQQLSCQGASMLIATDSKQVSGAAIIFRVGDWANLHLMAVHPGAMKSCAGAALLAQTIEQLRAEGSRLFNLGGSAGLQDAANDGLWKFKKRWGDCTGETALLGKVLNPSAYQTLCSGRQRRPFFPAYRG